MLTLPYDCYDVLQDFICPPREEIFSVYLGHARAHDKASFKTLKKRRVLDIYIQLLRDFPQCEMLGLSRCQAKILQILI